MSWKLGQGKDCSGKLEKEDRFPNTSVWKIDILSNGATWPNQNGALFGDKQYQVIEQALCVWKSFLQPCQKC